jgi:NAD(P)H-flavin reductase
MNVFVGRPPVARSPWHGRPARLVAVERETPDVATYRFAGDAAVPFLPGQFNMLHLPGIGAAALSISSDAADPTTVAHTVRAVGDVTRALAGLRPGAGVLLRGPWGAAWPLDGLRGRDVAIVAGGVGLASLRAAIVDMIRRRAEFGAIALVIGGRSPADLLFAREHDAWRDAGLDVRTIVDRPATGWRGPVGLVTDLVAGLDFDPRRTSLLCCGPEPMMQAVAAAGIARGLASTDVFLAVERQMACAAGLCGLCQLGPAFVCRDGPVFRHDRIAPLLAVRHL